jgi:hypothetical protein|tara:strand:- start:159 stop:320 length:162 start_codon:yes stop_codon:yes gene_type:complete
METLGALIIIAICMTMGSFATIVYQDRHIWTKEYILKDIESRIDAHVNEQPWK